MEQLVVAWYWNDGKEFWHLFCPKPNNKDEDTVYFIFEQVSFEKKLLSVSNNLTVVG